MKYQNVKKYSSGYPSKEQTLKDPILLKNTPDRWKGIAACCSALSLVTFSACAEVEKTIRSVLQGTVFQQQIDGGISAPTFSLSEPEAVSIIAEELLLNGIEVDVETGFEVEAPMPVDIKFDMSNYKYEYSELNTKFEADGKVKDKKLYFEYISSEDFANFTSDDAFNELYQRADFMYKYIETLEKGTKKTDKGDLIKIFYEDRYYNKQRAEEDLRKQVREFIEHLKESGGI